MTRLLPDRFRPLQATGETIGERRPAINDAGALLAVHLGTTDQALVVFDHFGRDEDSQAGDRRVIRDLGDRLSGSAAAAVTLMLSGQYQAAALPLRDMAEIGLLLDDFNADRTRIAVWQAADKAKHDELIAEARARRVRDWPTVRPDEASLQTCAETLAKIAFSAATVFPRFFA